MYSARAGLPIALCPATMYALIAATGSLSLGFLLDKLAADLAFYLAAIVAYGLRKRFVGE